MTIDDIRDHYTAANNEHHRTRIADGTHTAANQRHCRICMIGRLLAVIDEQRAEIARVTS